MALFKAMKCTKMPSNQQKQIYTSAHTNTTHSLAPKLDVACTFGTLATLLISAHCRDLRDGN
jgi:hypothetical protein